MLIRLIAATPLISQALSAVAKTQSPLSAMELAPIAQSIAILVFAQVQKLTACPIQVRVFATAQKRIVPAVRVQVFATVQKQTVYRIQTQASVTEPQQDAWTTHLHRSAETAIRAISRHPVLHACHLQVSIPSADITATGDN